MLNDYFITFVRFSCSTYEVSRVWRKVLGSAQLKSKCDGSFYVARWVMVAVFQPYYNWTDTCGYLAA